MGEPGPIVTRNRDVTVVTLGPEYEKIEDALLGDLQPKLLEITDEAEPPLVALDLSHTDFFGSSFIEVMFRVHNRLKDRDGHFAVCCLQPYCREVIEITHLDRVWTIKLTLEEAIDALLAA